ncbi:DUF3560 domain-containing protein [Comamonadaceae bacterium OH2310_COT-174]|nr:DUF3560 domain-containing protein [Comamonadaceae bacterium OH2310_COT-174]
MRRAGFEGRAAARRKKLEQAAEKAEQKGRGLLDRAHAMAAVIPFGQPVLLGHHSEKRDRSYREKIHTTFGKGFAELEKARSYAEKASGVGRAGISSDDPDAIEKLTEKLRGLERAQELMKKANAIIRRHKDRERCLSALVQLEGVTEEKAVELLKPDLMGRVGFPAYALSNNNAVIHATRRRIAMLQRSLKADDVHVHMAGFEYREDVGDNRIHFVFSGKPEAAVRDLLKRWGFKWSPSRPGQPWVRLLNPAGQFAAKMVIEQLMKQEG